MTRYPSDQLLLTAIAQGRPWAFEKVRKDSLAQVIYLVKQNSGSQQDAEEIFQEALVVLYQKAQTGITLTASLPTFIYRICQNKWLHQLRQRKRNRISYTDDISGYEYLHPTDPDIVGEDATELLAHTQQVIANLTPQKQALLWLSAYTTLSGDEIARKTGYKNRNVVKVRLTQARNEVKRAVTSRMRRQ